MKVTKIDRLHKKRTKVGTYTPSIIYVNLTGETIWENLQNRRTRPYTEWRRLLAPLAAELGIPEGARLAWNRRAGCSCPCSPGFNVRRADGSLVRLHDEGGPYDVTVTVEG